MSADPILLDHLIESIADGTPIDWADVEARAQTDRDRRVVRHLRLVAGVADVHRTVTDEDDPHEPATVSLLEGDAQGQSFPRWGHLMLLEKVGEGTFGEVYRAQDTWLDREVALKLLKPVVTGAVPPPRVLQEARTLARIRHQNVVTVHGADMHDGRVGLWMEFVRGQTLSRIVSSQGPFSAGEAAVIGQELCRALAAVHGAGLVHRDIKAQNVMRESGGRLVLMDFGAGHPLDGPQPRATGTPIYQAPELLAGRFATVRSDLYALGVLLFYLVTGRFPVRGSTYDELEAAHRRGERLRLAAVRPDLPEGFAATVERAIDPDGNQRFANAKEFQDALERTTAPATREVATAMAAPAAARGRWTLGIAAVAAALALAGGLTWFTNRTPAPPGMGAPRLLAVMPLRISDDASRYLAEGMTEALMQELAGIRAFRVVSRTSVEQAQRDAGSLRDVASALSADAILEGSVQGTPEAVQVHLRLIHAGSDTPVWVRTFEEPMRNVFELQREIARTVAAEFKVGLPAFQTQPPQPVNASAHDDYLRGQYLMLRGPTIPEFQEAIRFFESALKKDPQHAGALAAMGQALYLMAGSYFAIPRDEGFARAKEALSRALAINPNLAHAYAVQADIHFQYEWDWQRAEQAFTRALSLNPSLEFARERFSLFLAARQRLDEARAQTEELRRINPLSVAPLTLTGAVLRYARRYEEAEQMYRRALVVDPRLLQGNIGLGRTLNAMGRYDEAIEIYSKARDNAPNQQFFVTEIAQAHADAGRRREALALLDDLKRRAGQPGWTVPPEAWAYIYAHLGDRDAAFQWLDAAFNEKSSLVLWFAVDPRVDPLRSDPRFGEFLKRLGLPAAAP